MASKAYEGNFKARLLAVEPAQWKDTEDTPQLTSDEWDAGTVLADLVSDGGVSYTFTTNTASQAKLEQGKVGHNIGTREVTGVSVTHERQFPVADDAMFALYEYGDKRWLAISPDGEPEDEHTVHVFEIETGEKELFQPGRDTIQNMMVNMAVQDWNLDVAFVEVT